MKIKIAEKLFLPSMGFKVLNPRPLTLATSVLTIRPQGLVIEFKSNWGVYITINIYNWMLLTCCYYFFTAFEAFEANELKTFDFQQNYFCSLLNLFLLYNH